MPAVRLMTTSTPDCADMADGFAIKGWIPRGLAGLGVAHVQMDDRRAVARRLQRRIGDLARGDGNGGMLADRVARAGDGAGYDDLIIHARLPPPSSLTLRILGEETAPSRPRAQWRRGLGRRGKLISPDKKKTRRLAEGPLGGLTPASSYRPAVVRGIARAGPDNRRRRRIRGTRSNAGADWRPCARA